MHIIYMKTFIVNHKPQEIMNAKCYDIWLFTIINMSDVNRMQYVNNLLLFYYKVCEIRVL